MFYKDKIVPLYMETLKSYFMQPRTLGSLLYM